MCGLAGIFISTPPGQPAPEIPDAWLDLMDASIAHRGPDGSGRFRDVVVRGDGSQGRVAFVHRRLSVLDLAGGRQPMTLAEGTSEARTVVFNGCIYNHRQLRWNLASAGAKFATDHSDTEVLLHAHKAWGAAMTGHLEGMYAFGVWSRGEGTLMLARDLAGEKPVCYASMEHEGTRLVVFASGPVGVAGVLTQAVPRVLGRVFALRAAHMNLWLRFGAGGVSAFEHVEEVGPGCALVFGSGEPRMTSLPLPAGPVVPLNVEATSELLAQSVEARLDADVPIGCMLSGGIDSGLVAVFAQRALAKRGRRLRTFTVRMPGGIDESSAAEETARHLGTEHTTLDCEPDIAGALPRLIHELGTPFGDSSILPTFWLSRAMRQHVTVALTGDGGDELFGGYDRHTAAL
ncbi:MAG: asparagine synthase (glutamine-hydrolyzing), partial [Phycisphaerales bacterium]